MAGTKSFEICRRFGKSLQNLIVEFAGFNAAAHLKKAGEAFIMETVC